MPNLLALSRKHLEVMLKSELLKAAPKWLLIIRSLFRFPALLFRSQNLESSWSALITLINLEINRIIFAKYYLQTPFHYAKPRLNLKKNFLRKRSPKAISKGTLKECHKTHYDCSLIVAKYLYYTHLKAERLNYSKAKE